MKDALKEYAEFLLGTGLLTLIMFLFTKQDLIYGPKEEKIVRKKVFQPR